METEIWKPIPKHPFYEASSFGRIQSLDREVAHKIKGFTQRRKGKILSPNTLPKGYRTVMLEGQRRRCVHLLVLEAFIGPCPEGMECAHEDGNPGNNRVENLSWKTPTANAQDKKKHGTYYDFNNCLTEEQAIEVRGLISTGNHSVKDLAERFGTSSQTISRIKNSHTRRELGAPIKVRAIFKLTADDDAKIHSRRKGGEILRSIAHDFKVTVRAVVVAIQRHEKKIASIKQ